MHRLSSCGWVRCVDLATCWTSDILIHPSAWWDNSMGKQLCDSIQSVCLWMKAVGGGVTILSKIWPRVLFFMVHHGEMFKTEQKEYGRLGTLLFPPCCFQTIPTSVRAILYLQKVAFCSDLLCRIQGVAPQALGTVEDLKPWTDVCFCLAYN